MGVDGQWESGSRSGLMRRVAAPLALVVAGMIGGAVTLPSGPEPGFPIDVQRPDRDPLPDADAGADALLGEWSAMAGGPLSARQRVVSVWTGRELVVWGGRVALRGRWFGDGAAYDPRTGRWRRLPPSPLRARAGASGVWTGTEVVIWGGAGAAGGRDAATDDPAGDLVAGEERAPTTQAFADGAAYNPTTDRWRRLPPGPLSARRESQAVWTGEYVVFWGGWDVGGARHRDIGARYHPATDTWSRMRRAPLDGDARDAGLARAVAFDGRMMLWVSSFDAAQVLVYDPAGDDWRRVPTPALRPGVLPAMAPVGGDVLLWGGWRFDRRGERLAVRYSSTTRRWIPVTQPERAPPQGQQLVGAGAAAIAYSPGGGVVYDAVTDRWTAMRAGPDLPAGTVHVWAGDHLVVWSPQGQPDDPSRGARWQPGNPWRVLPPAPAAIDAAGAAVWTGWLRGDEQVVLWGGLDHGAPEVGAVYDPEVRLWERLDRAPLTRRVDPSAVWSGKEVLVVGGRVLPDAPGLPEAAAYDPATHGWRALPDAPFGVAGDAAVVGRGLLYAATPHPDGVAVATFDLDDEEWNAVPDPPIPGAMQDVHVVWTEFEVWVWATPAEGEGAGAAWDPRRRRWRRLPPLRGLSGPVTSAWASSRVYLVDARGHTASLGRGGVSWRRYPRSPVRTTAAAAEWNGHAVLVYDPQAPRMAALDALSGTWVPVPPPPLPRSDHARLLWTGRDMFAFAGEAGAALIRAPTERQS